MAGTSLAHLVSKVYTKRFALTPLLEKTNTGANTRFETSCSNRPWQGPHFPVLCPRLVWKHLSPHQVFKKRALAPKLARTCQISLAHGQDLTFPSCVKSLCEKIGPHNHFWKKRTPAPELVWTCQKFLAHSRDLTFPSWIQSWGENMCPHTPFWKNEHRRRSLSGHVKIS